MENPLVLAFDLGTQSMKATLMDRNGNTVLSSQVKYGHPCIPSDVRGKAEQEPDFYYERLCEASRLLREKDASGLLKNVIAVTLTCIRDTVMILDKDRRALRNIIVWMDERRAAGKPKPPALHKLLFSMVGMTETIELLYKSAFCNWIKEEEPELWAKADKFVFLSSYMNYKLTGVLKDGTANQVGHIPFDYRNRKWMKKGLSRCVADIPVEMLVDLVDSPGVVGYLSADASRDTGLPEGLPLVTVATDKACEALGLSVMTEDKAAISLGTASTIQFCSPHYFEPCPFLPSYPSVMPGFYNGEYQLYRGYWILTWFIRNFCDEERRIASEKGVSVESILDKYLDEVPAGSGGLVLTPHLSPGNNNPFAKGVLMGLSDYHDKRHFYRAIIEGIDLELYHAMVRMEKRSGQKIRELYIAGGGSVSDSVVQICCDVFGLPVKRVQTPEASSLGASIASFVSMGEYSTFRDAVKAMVHDKDVFTPDMEKHRVYMEIYNDVYSHIEKDNTKYFRKLRKFGKES
ncbi:MAG: FGGY-family carbohydrate kinase [Spirochaetales bacterium]|nr:FGGY-family carbohydrate kinase [Spirochaetales bacterium]